ncbi:MAG TPA: pitrilysin family protein [Candidatus Aminicenantes bacterium]|nr:pitrilysin family protein [Candidatus Aminicenantes bacterium]HRY65239.1 pitrilysin family protein [Candidatus Aminicenantes bacterium]HRZ72293.1 pitrilysin family protein [Candidatus Aminicenantes bacterium]
MDKRRWIRWVGPAALAAGLGLAAASAARAEGPGRFLKLDNGLRVFFYEKRDIPLVHVVAGFDVGSKDETDGTNGLVHFLEHALLFRSGSARTGAEMRRHGAYFNGHTGQDLSMFEISLPSSEAAFALEALKDLLFGLELRQEEIDREKEIIREELNQMEDDPERRSVDLVLQALFPGHPYGRSVYGRAEVVAAATAEDLRLFHRKFFVADNCAMAVVGDFETAGMERLVRDVFGPLAGTGYSPPRLPPAGPLKKGSSAQLERDVIGGYLTIGFAAPDYNSTDLCAMNVLVEALGRGINPLLGGYLRGQRDSVQYVTMSYLAFRYGGAALVSIKADPRDLPFVERAAQAFLKRAGSLSYSKKDFADPEAEMAAFDYLEMARNQIRFAAARVDESGLQLAGGLVRHMLLNTRDSPGTYLERIGRVDSTDLRRAAGRYFGRSDAVAVSIVPLPEVKK